MQTTEKKELFFNNNANVRGLKKENRRLQFSMLSFISCQTILSVFYHIKYSTVCKWGSGSP